MEKEEEYKLPAEVQLSVRHQKIAVSIFNSLVALIPFGVGTSIREGLIEYWSRVKQERINLFVVGLKEYFEQHTGEEIDTEFLRTEDFAQFFELVILKVSETKSKRKMDVFKAILITNIHAKRIHDFSETFLNIVGQLHEVQIEILKAHFKIDERYYSWEQEIQAMKRELDQMNVDLTREKNKLQQGHANNSTAIEAKVGMSQGAFKHAEEEFSPLRAIEKQLNANTFGLDKSIYTFYVQDLASKSLVMDMSGGTYGSAGKPYSRTAITEFGKQFVIFVKQSA